MKACRSSPSLWPLWLRVLVILVVIGSLASPLVIWRETIRTAFIHQEQMIAWVRAVGAWGPIALMGLAVAQVIAAPIPGQVINFVAGYLFGFWPGLFWSWLGLVIGSLAAMTLARIAGRPLVTRLINPARLAWLDQWTMGWGLRLFFVVFLIPGLPDDALCLLAGLTPLPLRALVAVAAIGRLPGIVAAVWAGAYAGQLPWQGWIALAGLTALMVVLTWRYGKRIQNALLSRMTPHSQRTGNRLRLERELTGEHSEGEGADEGAGGVDS